MIWAAAFAAFALLPLVGSDYLLQIGSFVAIQSIAVIGLGLLTGFAGRISLAQGALLGIGAYTAAILVTRAGVAPLAALPASILMAVAIGTLLGGPAIRLSGLYFVMSTIGLQQIVWIVLMHWSGLTNGPQGIRGIPALAAARLPVRHTGAVLPGGSVRVRGVVLSCPPRRRQPLRPVPASDQ